MAQIGNQLKQVFRRLRRAPMFTAITVFTLAAGIGANTAVFSVLEGALLKPLPYPQADKLVGVWLTAPGIQIKELNLSPSDYFIFREQNKSFQDVGLYAGDSGTVTGLAEPEQVPELQVTDGTLSILGVQPMLGRAFRKEDDVPGAADTVLLSYGYWRKRFGGDASAVGKTIVVDGKAREIIGVLPQKFHFLDWEDAALLMPFKFDRNKIHLGNFSFEGLAKLKDGVTLEQASADVARMLPIVMGSFKAPEGFSIKLFEDAHIGPNLRPLKKDVVGDVGSVLWILMGSIGMVLLIACANVGNLLLVRVEGRRQELALRAALGAGWGRIAGELMLESLTLGLISGLLGLGLAYAALRVFVAMAPAGIPRIQEIGVDGSVLLFTLSVSALASVLFGSIPVFKYAGSQLSTGIREGGRSLSQSREQHRARSVLVVVQVALALVLLICSGLMIRTFSALTKVNPGFAHASELQTFRISIPETQVKEPERVVRLEEEILHRIETIPGVESVAITTKVPMDNSGSMDPIFVEGRSLAEGQLPPIRRFKFVSPRVLATLGTPLIAGREFTWEDNYKKLPVAMISENVAREYWPDAASALGKRIRVATNDDWREIVGVVGNVYDDGVNQEVSKSVYWPLLMDRFESNPTSVRGDVAYVVRSSRTGSQNFLSEVRQAVWSVNPNLPLATVHTQDFFYKKSMARTSFTLIMLGAAGSMALLLGVVGIYGVIAYSVSQRTREIGIRMALGAQQKTLTGMFVRHGLMLTGIGVACGLAVSFAVMRLMSTLLFKVSPADPVTYAAVSIGLGVTAFLASYLPSRRAATVDPVEALRAE
jgi:predicted permease